jgi:two-component system chemotaxis response regulator CheB
MDTLDPPLRAPGQKVRVLVVDDSAYNRQTISAMLESDPMIEVIGRASNGKEALRQAFDLHPDAITLDLEMPEMDGFAFLRLLMAKRPVPVIIISSHSERDNVFRALELGAMDFIAKPGRHIGPDLRMIQDDLVLKIRTVARLSVVRLLARAQALVEQRSDRSTGELPAFESGRYEAGGGATPPMLGVLGIAASTGGPPAIQQLLCALPPTLPLAILVAQHMPARFTRAFAARLDKICAFQVVEASDAQVLRAGTVYIAPGAANLEVELYKSGNPPVRVARVRVRGGRRGRAPTSSRPATSCSRPPPTPSGPASAPSSSPAWAPTVARAPSWRVASAPPCSPRTHAPPSCPACRARRSTPASSTRCSPSRSCRWRSSASPTTAAAWPPPPDPGSSER